MVYATYNITDDKIRLSLGAKPSPEQIAAMRQAGFTWWPASNLNVAKWSTTAEDYVLGLGIEIEEDDRPDDVAARVERFSGYAESAASNADSASRYAHNLLAPIPAGQPAKQKLSATLKRADAAMQRAVSETEREAHWRNRIAAAIAHAEYKERPDVIARRIKGLEADERTYLRELEKKSEIRIRAQIFSNMCNDVRKKIDADFDSSPEVWAWIETNTETFKEELEQIFSAVWEKHERWAKRWLEHIRKRLEYERALLEAMGGSPKLKWELQVGGQVEYAGNWHRIIRLNKRGGELVSVTVDTKRYGNKLEVGGITGYLEPTAEDTERAKAKTKRPPLCNYLGDGFHSMTKAEWEKISGCYKSTKEIAENGLIAHRVRYHLAGGGRISYVFISDQKETWPEKANYPDGETL